MKNFISLTIITLSINWRFLNFWLLLIPLQLSISFSPFISFSSSSSFLFLFLFNFFSFLYGASDRFRAVASRLPGCKTFEFYEVRILASRTTPNLDGRVINYSFILNCYSCCSLVVKIVSHREVTAFRNHTTLGCLSKIERWKYFPAEFITKSTLQNNHCSWNKTIGTTHHTANCGTC
jgi:hypothetical protein